MSAVSVNNWLVHAGLQYRTDDRKIPYRPNTARLSIFNSALGLGKRLKGKG
ncbi:hypothetical protein [Nostoc sp.]